MAAEDPIGDYISEEKELLKTVAEGSEQKHQKELVEGLQGLFIGGRMLDPTEVRDTQRQVKSGQERQLGYRLVNPLRNYRGKSYAEWVTDWFNWFLSAGADRRNSGPVVFLRSHGLPNKETGANISEVPSEGATSGESVSDSNEMYRAIYLNDPNVRIGSDRLQIFDNQAIFVPIIVAYDLSIPTQLFKDWGRMQDFTGLTIDYGDNPPYERQLTINTQPIALGGMAMRNFRIVTPVFTAVVPDAPLGESIKDFLEDSPITPGSYPALVEGYFLMIRFLPGNYWVHSWASAPRERARPYFSELLYEIEVTSSVENPHRGLVNEGGDDPQGPIRPARNERLFNRIFYEKTKNGELSLSQVNSFRRFFSSSLNLDKSYGHSEH